uniref:Uncharacterized protein n=1 Tax=Glossina austeni TaxID=7395 RepID=A0A1A9VES6_GLOAU
MFSEPIYCFTDTILRRITFTSLNAKDDYAQRRTIHYCSRPNTINFEVCDKISTLDAQGVTCEVTKLMHSYCPISEEKKKKTTWQTVEANRQLLERRNTQSEGQRFREDMEHDESSIHKHKYCRGSVVNSMENTAITLLPMQRRRKPNDVGMIFGHLKDNNIFSNCCNKIAIAEDKLCIKDLLVNNVYDKSIDITARLFKVDSSFMYLFQ